jgi:hypothetical protein
MKPPKHSLIDIPKPLVTNVVSTLLTRLHVSGRGLNSFDGTSLHEMEAAGTSKKCQAWLLDHHLIERRKANGVIHLRLTKSGAAFAQWIAKCKPRWKKKDHELWFDGLLIKHFDRPAKKQILLVVAFQEQHWARCIFDPLPPDLGVDRQKRLENAIQRLNGCLLIDLLWFGSNGAANGIRWEILRPNRH